MPRLPALRTRALADLARQVRFASPDAARRQMERAEGLVLELLEEMGAAREGKGGRGGAPVAAFPQEWVIFRITGMRMETDGGGQPDLLVRDALLGDLCALAERLSSAAGLGPRALTGSWLNVGDLMARWGMSRSTLERARRSGLAGRRVALGRGREELRFDERMVRAFERARGVGSPERDGGKKRLTRMSEEGRDTMIADARALRVEHSWTLDRCARELSARHGRAKETVRRLLRAHDERAAEAIFDERPPLAGHERAVAEHAAARGERVTRAAARLARSRATVYRVVKASRAGRLRALGLEDLVLVLSAAGERKVRATTVLVSPFVCTELGRPSWGDAERLLAEAAKLGPVGAAEERARAAAYHLLIARAAVNVGALPRHGPRAADLDAIETDLLWASRLKAELVRSQLPLLVRTLDDRLGGVRGGALTELAPTKRADLLGSALAGLIESVGRFDPARGGRLAAPVAVALGKVVAAWIQAHHATVDMAVAQAATGPRKATARRAGAEVLPGPADDWTRRVNPWQAFLDLDRATLDRLDAARLGDRERLVVTLRYGLAGAPPQTPGAIGAAMGIPGARVSGILRRTLARVRG